MSKTKGKKKTYGISLNDTSEVDAALMRELDARGNTATTLRAALRLLFWGEATELPPPPEHPLAELTKMLIAEQQQTRQELIQEARTTREETINAIRGIQIVMPLEMPTAAKKNGNGHHKQADREDPDDLLVRNMIGINFNDAFGES